MKSRVKKHGRSTQAMKEILHESIAINRCFYCVLVGGFYSFWGVGFFFSFFDQVRVSITKTPLCREIMAIYF